jgi:hypothetical protein
MNSSVLIKSRGFVAQSLPKLRGNRPAVVAALLTMLLFIAGCGGSNPITVTPTPAFTPAAGTYAGTQYVTVSDTNQTAVLYCTNDGSTPTASSAQCANPITVSQSQTLRAIAIAPGVGSSAVATAAYTITASASASAPTVAGIGPASGTTAGGTSVTIIGSNFTSASSVSFGTTAALSVTVNSATSITAISPAGSAGSVHVTVVTASGRSATSTADLFTYSAVASAPAVTGISPNSVPTGSAGFTLTVSGTNFVPGAIVQWTSTTSSTSSVSGTTALRNIAFSSGNSVVHANAQSSTTSLTTTFVSSTELQAAVPSSLAASDGSITIAVTNPDGSSSGSSSTGSTFSVGVPTIASTFPTSVTAGSAGFALAVNGTNFASGASVLWGSTALTTTLVSSTQLMAAVPASLIATTGTVTLTVNDSAGTSSGATFTIVDSAPLISSLNTSSGRIGSSVTINGSNFGSTQGTVTFNGTPATSVTYWSSTSIVAVVPSGATTGNIVVTVNNVASNGEPFTVLLTPTITRLSTTSSAAGTSVTLYGTNFGTSQGASTVTFPGSTTAASITSWSNTQIAAMVPSDATGTGNVVVTVNEIPSAGTSFTVLPTPTITSLSTASGAVNTSVTLYGTNFGTSQGASTVTFPGTTTAASITSWNSTTIVATVPSSATGTGDVVVTVNGVASAGTSFTVLATPTISSLSMYTGAVGASVTINGMNFGSSQGSSTVTFNGKSATVTSWNASSIVVKIPTDAATGQVLVTVNGVASAGVAFTVSGSPEIDSLDPAYGLPGASVTITGQNLGTTQGTVLLNGTPATITSWSASSIGITVPTGATTGDVTVTASGVTTNGLLFTITPTISLLSPTSGAVGASVTITGRGFGATPTSFSTTSSTVTFPGTTTTATIAAWSDTSIEVTVPTGATGSGYVVVTVNGAPSAASAASQFTVPPPPAITSLSPSIAMPGGAAFTLTVNGSNFDSSAVVHWGSTALTTNYVSATQVTATVPDNQTAGTVDVTVSEDNGTSNSETFTITTYISGTVLSGPASSGVPISASVQLYAAGTTGYGMGSQAIGSAVQTDSTTGVFSAISFDCSTYTAPNDQLYLVATSTSSSQIVLMTALGSCASIDTSFPNGVTINESTTVASAFALAGFANVDTTNGGIEVGAPTGGSSCSATAGWKSTGPSTCNYIGLKNAFATVPNLVDIPSGQTLAVTPAYCTSAPCVTATSTNTTSYYKTSIVPQGRINAMANALSACVRTSSSCSTLRTATAITTSSQIVSVASGTTVTPDDTLQAALNIAHCPGGSSASDSTTAACGVDVKGSSGIYSLVTPDGPFQPALSNCSKKDNNGNCISNTSSEFSLALIFQGGGLGASLNQTGAPVATGLAIDASGNVWVPATSSIGGSLAVFNNQGAPITTSGTSSSDYGGYTGSGNGVYNPQSIAIDQSGNAWIGNSPANSSSNGTLSEIQLSGSTLTTLKSGLTNSSILTGTTLLTPSLYGLAIDTNGKPWVSSNTEGYSTGCGGTYGGSILEFDSSGTLLNGPDGYLNSSTSCPTTIAFDESGYLWTYNNSSDTNNGILQIASSSGDVSGGPYNVPLNNPSYSSMSFICGGMDNPSTYANMAIDSGGYNWFAGGNDNCMYVIPNLSQAGASLSTGTWGAVLFPTSGQVWVTGVDVMDGGDNAWAFSMNSSFGYLVGYNSMNATDMTLTDTALLSNGGYQGSDPSANASGRTGGTWAINPRTSFVTGLGVDGSGNLWAAGKVAAYYSTTEYGSQLTEFIGIAVPTQTPLATALTNNTAMTAKGQTGQGQRP